MRADAKVSQIEIVDAEIVPDFSVEQISLLERLLSARSLQWLMASGGGLLVLGFAIWLWSIGVFENPIILAAVVGAINVGLLGVGLWLIRFTRLQLAGRGMALVSSLALPLNLWLYHSQGLLSLELGDPLWVPALICCAIYAATARISRDSLFVYGLVGGIALTAALFLAGAPGNLFWSVIPLSVFLVAFGGVCIVADSWFLDTETTFCRDRFGRAFFISGHVVQVAGLLLLACGQFADFVADLIAWGLQTPAVMNHTGGQIWVLVTLAFSTIAYAYSNFTRRRNWLFSVMAVLLAVLSLLQSAIILQIEITLDAVLIVGATLLLLANIAQTIFQRAIRWTDSFGISVASMVVGLLLYVALAIVQGGVTLSWPVAVQAMLGSAILMTLPGVWRSENQAAAYAILTFAGAGIGMAVYSLAGIMAGLTGNGLLLVAVPALALAIAVQLTHVLADRLAALGNGVSCAALVLWFYVLVVTPLTFSAPISIALVGLIAVSCGLFSYAVGDRLSLGLAAKSITLVAVQSVIIFDLANGFAIISLMTGLAIAANLAANVMKRLGHSWVPTRYLLAAGNSLTIVAVAGASLFALGALQAESARYSHLGLVLLQFVGLGVSTLCNTNVAWRRGFMICAIANLATAIALVINLSTLTVFQRFEIFCIAIGLLMVAMGYIGWSRESRGQRSDTVSFALLFGSCILVVPFIIGIVMGRMAEPGVAPWRLFHEVGGILTALTLLGSGILCRIRSTTITGGALLLVFVLSAILLIHIPDQLQQTSVLMMVGGAVFFLIATVLSIYREYLIGLPAKISEGKGIFRNLKWR